MMDNNLLESNERTLVLFDSVCSGLSECLALVHEDIKQMTKHRDKLAQIEQGQSQLINPLTRNQELVVITNNGSSRTKSSRSKTKQQQQQQQVFNDTNCCRRNLDVHKADIGEKCGGDVCRQTLNDNDDDPHHLAGLKLLDKRLAESFSQELSLSDIQKSSLAAKQQVNPTRPSIFQVLLGKSMKSGDSKKKNEFDKNNLNMICENDNANSTDNKMIIDDINRQTRLAMQYSKQLEANLFRVEDLRARYEMHLKMGLVVKSVSRAYLNNGSLSHCSSSINPPPGSLARRHCSSLVINDSSSLGTRSSLSSLNLSSYTLSKSSLNLTSNRLSWKGSAKARKNHQASKTTIKEFIENIDKIEAEFESLMGSFLLAIEDIQGFARVCQGDVFEISIKYGDSQKFKTRISVLKDSRQKCDSRQTVFKARISDILAIKAYECKGLGKRVLLGHKLCETRDLFTARSQLMTVSLNQTGSIKLNLIVTWNPLHLSPNSSSALPGVDISHISLPPTPVSSSTLSSLSSVPSMSDQSATTTTIKIQSSRHHRNKSNNSPPNMDTQHHHSPNMYQTVDPTYGYYIPPPDYLTNEQK